MAPCARHSGMFLAGIQGLWQLNLVNCIWDYAFGLFSLKDAKALSILSGNQIKSRHAQYKSPESLRFVLWLKKDEYSGYGREDTC
jgi:hypothetical protein